MKTLLPPRGIYRILWNLIFLLSLSTASYSQTFFGMSSSPTDNNIGNGPTATVTPPASMLAGDLVIVYGQCRNTTATLAIAAGTGQTWNSGAMYQPRSSQTIFISWCRFNGTWSGGGNVSVTGGTLATAITAVMYVYRPTVATNTWGVNIAQANANGNGLNQSIAGTTTTLPNTVTMAFWSNAALNTWAPSGIAPINTGWTFPIAAGQIRNSLVASQQSHTAAYNIQALPATLNNTQQTQSANTVTMRSTMSWYELNDEYSDPVTLTSGASCTNIDGTMAGATISSGIPTFSCFSAGTFLFDVWYSFTATRSTHTITLSNFGGNFTRRQLAVYQVNTLGALSPVTCSAVSTGATSVNFTDYSPGTTYLIRVLYPSTTNTPITTNGGFRICVTNGTNNSVQNVLSGKSYTNVTRPNGGTILTGDVLEFRQSINPGDWSTPAGAIFNVSYHDTIPTGLSYVANSIRLQTNEGLAFESGITNTVNLTDASGDDEAVYSGGVLRVNVGSLPRDGGSTIANRQLIYQGSPAVTPITYASAGGGKIHSKGRPSQFATFVVIVVTYRVTVTAATGTNFTTSNGQFRYKTTTSSTNDVTSPPTSIIFPRYTVHVSESGTSLCQSGTGTNVYPGGNFGSGNRRHDSTQLTIAPQYTWAPFSSSNPGDGFFSVVNNTSSYRLYTNKFAPFPSSGTGADTVRVFGVWDIIGDHTGAANPDSGNLAVPWGTTGGYMGVVNAAFGINTAIQKNITGLCTNTYYEFSAWFKNICAGCSTDSAGRRMQDGALFKPYLGTKTLNDSAGVSPDLTYTIDGVDYYTTGPIIYDKKWIKKGFLFKTDASGSVTLTIRNNAPGGGGNDWAIDDISLTTCFPGMKYSPTANPNICENNSLVITDTVRYIYNNYIYYKWQRYTTASGVWTDIAGTSGTASPTLVGGMYEFVSAYTIPPGSTTAANDGDLYRLIVASTPTNLALSTCSYSDPTPIELNVLINCGPPLKADLLSVAGQVVNSAGQITWITSKEDEPVYYIVEKSIDGRTFVQLATVPGYNNPSTETNHYIYNDPTQLTEKVFYRIIMVNNQNNKKYSKIIQLGLNNSGYNFNAVVNPFNSELQYEISSATNGIAKIELIDGFGRTIRSESRQLKAGSNSLSISNTDNVPAGIYVLRASINGNVLVRKVMKESK